VAALQSSSGLTNSGIVIAASTRADAEAWAGRAGLEARIVDRRELVACRGRLERLDEDAQVVLHSVDWSREHMPQLYRLALARSLRQPAAMVDERRGDEPRPLSAAARVRGGLAAGPEALAGLARAAVEAARGARRGRPRAPRPRGGVRTVVAVWPGGAETRVGGAVTHAAGILGGFRALGLRVHLIAEAAPPGQLAAAADDVEVLPPLPPSARAIRRVERLAVNAPLRGAIASALNAAERPVLYARHGAMSTAPAEVAGALGIPFVLEWNASERWAQEHWVNAPSWVQRTTLPVVAQLERRVVAQATVIAAVSRSAAEMARSCGAPADALITVPNAVDPAEIDRLVGAREIERGGESPPTVGWIGTFGVWHGAEVLIRAAATEACAGIRFTMIGDGTERSACERLADELGVRDRVEFTGRLPREQALPTLAACDVLASPTVPLGTGEDFFGSPTKIFEYMALRRPIVASDLAQIGEVLADRHSALLTAPGSVEGTAAAIGELVADPELAARLAVAARAEAEARHRWEDRAGAILAALAGE
jgi:glycosyltransferase involved in cell wall biosynthesis